MLSAHFLFERCARLPVYCCAAARLTALENGLRSSYPARRLWSAYVPVRFTEAARPFVLFLEQESFFCSKRHFRVSDTVKHQRVVCGPGRYTHGYRECLSRLVSQWWLQRP